MADFVKSYDDLLKSSEVLYKKFEVYVAASDYDGKKDVKIWLGELVKAMKELESALADTKAKLATMETAFEEFWKANKAVLEKDKEAMDALKKISAVMDMIGEDIKKITAHLNRNKAEA
jgi:hypothetical protein